VPEIGEPTLLLAPVPAGPVPEALLAVGGEVWIVTLPVTDGRVEPPLLADGVDDEVPEGLTGEPSVLLAEDDAVPLGPVPLGAVPLLGAVYVDRVCHP